MPDKSRWFLKPSAQVSPFELAMMMLSLISVVVILIMTFVPVDPETHKLLFYIDTGICFIFMSYFLIGLFQAENKLTYIKSHWVDFVASIPAIEALRFARLFQILRVLRLIRMSSSLIGPLLKQRRQATIASLLVSMVTIITIASVMMLLVESGVEGANIQTAENAIWWAIVTISTVGYGDFYPVTTVGHVIGGVVIVCGVSFFGVISGYMASLFVAPDEQESLENQSKVIKSELDLVLERMEANQQQMLTEIADLKQKLVQQQRGE